MKNDNGASKKIKWFFSRSSSKTTREEKKSKSFAAYSVEARLAGLWAWTLPLLLGGMIGWFCMVCLEIGLNEYNHRTRPAASVIVSAFEKQNSEGVSLASFLQTNPFKITPRPFQELPDDVEAPVVIVGSLRDAVVLWPITDVGVLLEDRGRQLLVPLDGSFDVYTLVQVDDRRATFARGEERVVKELLYSAGSARPSSRAQDFAPVARRETNFAQNVVASDPTRGIQGRIDRELVNRLMENPYEELNKARLRPAADGQGMQILWIERDSILAQLGVRQDDVIQGINGIVFRNAMDINNSLTSLMASDQFAVELMRNGVPTLLHYEVR